VEARLGGQGDSGGAHWVKGPAMHASGNLRALNRRRTASLVTKGSTRIDRSTASTRQVRAQGVQDGLAGPWRRWRPARGDAARGRGGLQGASECSQPQEDAASIRRGLARTPRWWGVGVVSVGARMRGRRRVLPFCVGLTTFD
jgi:hypothetical protein